MKLLHWLSCFLISIGLVSCDNEPILLNDSEKAFRAAQEEIPLEERKGSLIKYIALDLETCIKEANLPSLTEKELMQISLSKTIDSYAGDLDFPCFDVMKHLTANVEDAYELEISQEEIYFLLLEGYGMAQTSSD